MGLAKNPRHVLNGLQHDTWPNELKNRDAHPDGFLISTCFDYFLWLGFDIDVGLVKLESLSP